jgi:putative transposase
MTTTIRVVPDRIDQQQVAQQLVEAARAEEVELVGSDGLLTGLTKTVLETAWEAEMSEHPATTVTTRSGAMAATPATGTRIKTVLTDRAGADRGSARPRRRLRPGHRPQAPTTVGRDR